MSSAAMEQGSHTMKLYSSFMSSCSCRVRLALNMKGLKYECINVTPLGDPGEITENNMHFDF
ncbi:Glutathione S-transferase/chloride channel, C-terminal [Artemisia annua]|uniref:Glutathione S-transferase/chloride channel, C-terminal n=1 Tax=Artemisia annua TaxID=35608 RepID=A0A2U1MVR1_ARTAN|nr:Glutathione S-transferase/chloride channel, C-terminal [Artemisia annua]